MCQNCTPSAMVTAAAGSLASVGRRSSVCGDDDDGRVDDSRAPPTSDLAFVDGDRGSRCVPCLLGSCIPDRRRPVAVERSEDSTRPQDAGHLGRTSTTAPSNAEPAPPARRRQIRRARPVALDHPGTYRMLVAAHVDRSPKPHVVAGFDTDHLVAQPAAHRVDSPVPQPRSTRRGRSPAGVRGDDVSEHRWRHWANGVVEVGESREPLALASRLTA